ncbi:MAG: hypothetical protein CMF62_03285 [Magnetococcales bacterium]|nr:hypothetical protein [Magnetococcales bacterium]|tara:strand:+ start:353 stop:1168 length:816 start_codon:yes stop_codon:yes gene_type:complete
MDTNQNNGLITKIWGPSGWKFLHSVSFGYPIKPTNEQKNEYRNFFKSVGDILPCVYCRESYKKFIQEGCTKLDENALENRDSLTRWLYNIHEAVNEKLEVTYGVTYQDVVNKYESYRAKCSKQKAKGCLMPLDLKADSYKKSSIQECPIISYDIARHFIKYGKLRGLKKNDFFIMNECFDSEKFDEIIKEKTNSLWIKREKKCRKIIEMMRIDGIESIEKEGKFKGLPTLIETQLILMLCSNLTNKQLQEIIKKLPYYKEPKIFSLFKTLD